MVANGETAVTKTVSAGLALSSAVLAIASRAIAKSQQNQLSGWNGSEIRQMALAAVPKRWYAASCMAFVAASMASVAIEKSIAVKAGE